MTLQQLIDQFRSDVDDRIATYLFSDADVIGWLNEAEEEKLRLLWMKKGMAPCEGLIEIKCPSTSVHIATLLGAPIDPGYLIQMQWQMACTGRQWCDFASYDPRLPEEMRLFVQRVERDDAMIGDLEREVSDFLSDLNGKVAQLQALYGLKAAA